MVLTDNSGLQMTMKTHWLVSAIPKWLLVIPFSINDDYVEIRTYSIHGNLAYWNTAKASFSFKRSKNVKNDFRLMFIRDSSNSLGFMILSDFIWTMFHSSWISIVIIQIIYIGKVDTEVIRKSRTRSNADAIVRTVSAVPFDTEVIRFRGRNCLRRRHQVIIRHI